MATPRPVADCELRFSATFDAYARASAELREAVRKHRLGPGPSYKVDLVFEEIVSNIVRHGCPRDANCTIELAAEFRASGVVLAFTDDGRPFDPRAYAIPDFPVRLEDAGRGGLGLLLVRKASSVIDYERTADLNRLTITIPV
jgi:anti-sigma regulatory factor (Ser/Thr protein kinase)